MRRECLKFVLSVILQHILAEKNLKKLFVYVTALHSRPLEIHQDSYFYMTEDTCSVASLRLCAVFFLVFKNNSPAPQTRIHEHFHQEILLYNLSSKKTCSWMKWLFLD